MNGKRVLVTGGGSGAGADLALGFAKAGAKVVICGRRPNALAKIAAQHSAITALGCDVTDWQARCVSGGKIFQVGKGN